MIDAHAITELMVSINMVIRPLGNILALAVATDLVMVALGKEKRDYDTAKNDFALFLIAMGLFVGGGMLSLSTGGGQYFGLSGGFLPALSITIIWLFVCAGLSYRLAVRSRKPRFFYGMVALYIAASSVIVFTDIKI